MKSLLSTLGLLIAHIASAGDPISNLVLRLNSEIGGLWINGIQPRYDIGSNDVPRDIVVKVAKAWRECEITNSTSQIVEIRDVHISGPIGEWKAALIDCDTGKKVLLFSHLQGGGWWTRFYDEKELRAEPPSSAYPRPAGASER